MAPSGHRKLCVIQGPRGHIQPIKWWSPDSFRNSMPQGFGRFLLPRVILNETNGFNLKWILKANFLELDCVRMENLVNCHVNAQNTLFQPRDLNVFSFTICLCGKKSQTSNAIKQQSRTFFSSMETLSDSLLFCLFKSDSR